MKLFPRSLGEVRADLCRGTTLLAALATLGCGGDVTITGAPLPDPAVEPAPPLTYSCAMSTDARPMLAARIDHGLWFAYPDRSVREVFRFQVPDGGYVKGGAQVIARGDRVAAYAVIGPIGHSDAFAPFAELVVLDVDANQLFHERYDFAYDGWGSDSQLAGNADGTFVLTLMEVQSGLGVILDATLDATSAHTFTAKLAGRSDPDAKGRMVVADYEASSTQAFHFFDLTSGLSTPSRLWQGQSSASSAVVQHGGLTYLTNSPPQLLFETPEGILERPVDIATFHHASPGWMRSGGWALFHLGGDTAETVRYLATHVASGQTRELRLTPPDGWQLRADHWNPPAIDAQGRIIDILSDGERARAFATTDGNTWQPLGRPLTSNGYPIELTVTGTAIVVDGQGTDEAVPGALPAHAAQLVGPQGGDGIQLVRHDIQGGPDNPLYADDTLSDDGACLAYFKNGFLHMVESADYAVTDLAILSTTQSAEMAWIPRP